MSLAPHDPDFGRKLVIERPFTDTLFPAARPKGQGRGQRVGLSPKMLELNKRMHAAREAKGSSLTKPEMDAVRAEFAEFWATRADQEALAIAYQDWRESAIAEKDTSVAKFATSWGGGCFSSPISSAEFFQYHEAFG